VCGVYRDGSTDAIRENRDTLFQSEAFLDSIKIHCADVKHKYLLRVYNAFCVFQGQRRDRGNCYVVDGSEG